MFVKKSDILNSATSSPPHLYQEGRQKNLPVIARRVEAGRHPLHGRITALFALT